MSPRKKTISIAIFLVAAVIFGIYLVHYFTDSIQYVRYWDTTNITNEYACVAFDRRNAIPFLQREIEFKYPDVSTST